MATVIVVYVKYSKHVVQVANTEGEIHPAWVDNPRVAQIEFDKNKIPVWDPNKQECFIDLENMILTVKDKPPITPPEEPPVDIEQYRTETYKMLDNKLMMFVQKSDFVNVTDIHRLKYEEAVRFLNDANPDLALYPLIRAEVASSGAPAVEVANLYKRFYLGYVDLISEIEVFRRKMNVIIAQASTVADLDVARQLIESYIPDSLAQPVV